jgi:AraC-like DNA-binding protein
MTDLPGLWLLDAFQRGGVDTRQLAARLPELLDRALRDPAILRPDAVNRILLECEALSGDSHFGLHMTQYTDPSMYGTYGYLLRNAPTVGQLLELAERYYPTFYQGASITVKTRGGVARLEYQPRGSAMISPRHDNEWTLGFFVGFLRERFSASWHPRHVTFTNDPPPTLHELTRVFGPDIAFKQPRTGFEFDRELPGRTISRSDPQLLGILIHRAEALLRDVRERGPLMPTVRLEILDLLESGEATADRVAKRMAMSRSTLKRRLAQEGSSFRALRDEVVCEVASQALAETNVSAGDIALKLGYSELSAFHRAFHRLTGFTPTEFRHARRGRRLEATRRTGRRRPLP